MEWNDTINKAKYTTNNIFCHLYLSSRLGIILINNLKTSKARIKLLLINI